MKIAWQLIALAGFVAGSSLRAGVPDFSVEIVPHRQIQEHYFNKKEAGKDHGLVAIGLPNKPPENAVADSEDVPGNGDFYVIIRNVSGKTIRLDLAISGWFDSLAFTLSPGDGVPFEIHRPSTAWAANPIESWAFPPGGVRVLTVNFMRGRWQELPNALAPRAKFTIKARFTYREPGTNELRSCESKETPAENFAY